jgi:hypothetical protein
MVEHYIKMRLEKNIMIYSFSKQSLQKNILRVFEMSLTI